MCKWHFWLVLQVPQGSMESSPKMSSLYLLILMSFQTHMTDFLLWNIKGNGLKKVHAAFFHAMTVSGDHKTWFNLSIGLIYGGWESSTRCNFRKNMQIEKAPANKKNIFIKLTTHVVQMLTTQPNKEFYLQCVSLFVCVVSICSVCIVKLMKLFS